MLVEALQGFEHGTDTIRKGHRLDVSDVVAKDLQRAGLVVPVGPLAAVGVKPSASPAVQASPQTIAKPSGSGGRRRRKRAASS
jgi:hypothetical protein